MSSIAKLIALAAIGAVILLALFLRLQSVEPATKPTDSRSTTEQALPRALYLIRYSTDLATCRNVLVQVNRHLTHQPKAQTQGLPDRAREELRKQLALDAAEFAELEHPTFT